jgi:hypothetical protein
VDPIVGSWIIHIHVTAITPSSPLPPDFENITAFWEDGITTSSDPNPNQTTAYGVWRKLGPMTYATKIVQVNLNGTLTTIESMTSELIGNEMKASFQGKTTDSTGRTVLGRFSGIVMDERITFQSTPWAERLRRADKEKAAIGQGRSCMILMIVILYIPTRKEGESPLVIS